MASFPHSHDTGAFGGVVKRNFSGLWILAATILGSSMAFIDSTGVNVALPILQEDLGASISDLQWVINAYGLFLASLLLVGGALGDRLGRKRMFIVGIIIFTAASLWAGLSSNATSLILARALQGVGGAIFVPGSLALIGACFTDSERGSAIGTWSSASALTTVAGPVLGGWLAETFSWRAVFFINIPIAVIVIAIAILRVPESRDEVTGAEIDWWGGTLATLGLGGVVYGLTLATNVGFSDLAVIGSIAIGVAALIAFFVVESKAKHPMVPLNVFKNRSFTAANILTLLLYAALGGMIFFVPLNLVHVQGYSATAAGFAMLPFLVLIATISRWSGGLVAKIGAKIPLTIGPLIVAGGLLLFTLPEIEGPGFTTYLKTFFPAVAVMGLGMAITIAPLVTVVMSTVDQRLSGLASGINNAISRAAMLLAVAVMGVVSLFFFNGALDDQLVDRGVPQAIVDQLEGERVKLAGAEIPADLSEANAVVIQRAIDESFVDSFRRMMYLLAVLALGSALVALAFIQTHPAHGEQYKAEA